MEVPEWAAECTIRALPSLTIQYMSDSATVELTRDCGEEGVKQMTCRGKQDRDMILSEMLCSDELESLNADNSIRPTSESNQKADEKIKTFTSDNNEENTVESQVNKIEASAEKVIDKFNVDEMMLGDQPVLDASTTTDDDAKPTKQSKKAMESLKKTAKQMRSNKDMNKEEVMMGDQPMESLQTTAADEVLPHQKKSLAKDLKRPVDVSTSTPLKSAATVDIRNRRETEVPGSERIPITPSSFKTTTTAATTTTTIAASSSTASSTAASVITTTEPAIKITKKSFNTVREDSLIAHSREIKNETILSNDHFIPPMLMVRSQTPPPHSEDTTNLKLAGALSTTQATATGTTKSPFSALPEISSSTPAGNVRPSGKALPLKIAPPTLGPDQYPVPTTTAASETTTLFIPITVSGSPTTTISTEASAATTTTTALPDRNASSTSNPNLHGDPRKPSFHQPHAPKNSVETPNRTAGVPPTATKTETDFDAQHIVESSSHTPSVIVTASPAPTSSSQLPLTTGGAAPSNSSGTVKNEIKLETTTMSPKIGEIQSAPLIQANANDLNAGKISEDSLLNHPKRSSTSTSQTKHNASSDKHSENQHHEKHHHGQIDYSDSDGFQPYKPNRKRVLVKPTTKTYMQKIFG